MEYDAVVFDMDGVLVTGRHTPRSVYAEAMGAVFEARGVEATEDDVAAFVPPVPHARLAAICGRHGLRLPDVWADREARASELERELLGTPERDRFEDVPDLAGLDVPLGVVSNNRHETVCDAVERFALTDHGFAAWRGRDPTLTGYHRRKPDPYYLEAVVADLGADRPLFVGDRASDVATADAAGADSALLVRDGEAPDCDPTLTVDSLSALVARLQDDAADVRH